mgnify:CR=1 FL=1
MPTGHYLTQEQIDYIRRNFANTPNKELAKSLGISSSAISNIQRKYHLTKSREHTKAMHRLSGLASADSWGKIELTPEVLAKRAASFKKTWHTERARVLFGLPQKTQIHIKKWSTEKVRQNYYLRKRGYIIDEANLIAYYTEKTHRAKRLEAIPRGKKVGSIKPFYDFRPYNTKQ